MSRPSTSRTEIRLCGPMTVEIQGRAIKPPGGQGRMLLAYLAANHPHSVRRDDLIEAMWERGSPAEPDAGLSTVLSRLRRELGPGVLPSGTAVSLQLPDDAWIDLDVIEEKSAGALTALQERRPDQAMRLAREALALMKAELLPGLEASWIDERRRELEERQLTMREVSVEASLELGGPHLRLAERIAHDLVEQAPFRESGYALLMRVHAARGDFAEAIRVYDQLRILLRDELGTAPSPAVRELNERLLRHEELPRAAESAASSPQAVQRPRERYDVVPLPARLVPIPDRDFVGREEARTQLAELWEGTGFGPRVVVLTGEPGIGKTWLAACFGREVHAAGAAVLYGRCDEDPITSYQPLVEALDHYLRHVEIANLFRELPTEAAELQRLPALRARLGVPDGPADVTDDRYALFEAIVAILRREASERPLLLVLDDLHWADGPTFQLLLHLVRFLDRQRCMFLLTFRDVDISPPAALKQEDERRSDPLDSRLALLRREAEFDRLALSGLDENETAALISARQGNAPTDSFARRLKDGTGGNPFFIEEALRSLDDRDDVHEGAGPDLARLGVPDGVKEVIGRRLHRLGKASSDALASASVIGSEFTFPLLDAILASHQPHAPTQPQALDALQELVDEGLVVEVPQKPDRFAFSHALVRETQYASLLASRRTRIHERIALALEQQSLRGGGREQEVRAAELAHHFFEARDLVGPERAAHYSVAAAEQAEQNLAYEEASFHYDRALAVLEPVSSDEDRICDLLIAQGEAQLRAGKVRDARGTFRRVGERRPGDPNRIARAALALAGRWYDAEQHDPVLVRVLEEAEAALPPGDNPVRAEVMARLAGALQLTDTQGRATRLSGEAVEMARRTGDRKALITVLEGRHNTFLHIEHLLERLAVSAEWLELARKTGHRDQEALALNWRIYDLLELGDVDVAWQHYEDLEELAETLRQPLYLNFAASSAFKWLEMAGRFAEAEAKAAEAYSYATRAEATFAASLFGGQLYGLRHDQGRLGEVLRLVGPLVGDKPKLAVWRAGIVLARAEMGEIDQAQSELALLARNSFCAIPPDLFWLSAMCLLAEACAALPDKSAAAEIAQQLEPYADRNAQIGLAVFLGPVCHFLGLLATKLEDDEAARRHLDAALRQSAGMHAITAEARTECDYGEFLLAHPAAQDQDRGRELLERAHATGERLGMASLVRRTRQALQSSRTPAHASGNT